MAIQERLQSWLEAKGETCSPEKLEQVDEKTEEVCYTCAWNRDDLRRIVLQAAVTHLKHKQEREGIMGKIVLVTDTNCPPCDEVERTLKPLIDEGEIEVMDYSVCEECDREAVAKAGISTFPSLAIRSEDGLVVHPLSLAPKEETEPEAEETSLEEIQEKEAETEEAESEEEEE